MRLIDADNLKVAFNVRLPYGSLKIANEIVDKEPTVAGIVKDQKTKPTYTIKIPPVTKKNSQRIAYNQVNKRIFIAPSKQYKEYEKKAVWYLKPVPFAPIDKKVNIKCLFYMPTRRLCDLGNLINAADDILVKAHIIQDDNYHIVAGHDGSRVYVDKNNPRTEIYITEMDGENG